MLSFVLECVPGAYTLHKQHKNYLAVGSKRLLVEPAKSEEALGKCKDNPPRRLLGVTLTKSYARRVVIREVDHLEYTLATLQLVKSMKM